MPFPRTDHSEDIAKLRSAGDILPGTTGSTILLLAADLLELHDRTGISLDNWPAARKFVETYVGHEIQENHA